MSGDFWKILARLWFVLLILQLLLVGGVIWVAVHFIVKYW